MSVTKEFLLQETRKLWDEAYAADPYFCDELALKVLSPAGKICNGIFVWTRVSVQELRALRPGLYVVVLQARG